MKLQKEEYLDRHKNINRGFRKLEIWKEAVHLYKYEKELLINISNYKIKNQVEDSIFSVSSNIAEGYSRRSIKENIQFINIAMASLGENYSQVFTLFNSDDICEEAFHKFDSLHYSLENKMIAFIRSIIEKLNKEEPWANDFIIKENLEIYF